MMTGKRPAKENAAPIKERAVGMTVYLLPDDHRRLRVLAATEDTTIQSLAMDAIDALFATRGEPPVQRWEPRRRAR
jgi:hypothetical protein